MRCVTAACGRLHTLCTSSVQMAGLKVALACSSMSKPRSRGLDQRLTNECLPSAGDAVFCKMHHARSNVARTQVHRRIVAVPASTLSSQVCTERPAGEQVRSPEAVYAALVAFEGVICQAAIEESAAGLGLTHTSSKGAVGQFGLVDDTVVLSVPARLCISCDHSKCWPWSGCGARAADAACLA